MKRGLIDGLYDKAHVVHEIPYEASVVEPGHIAIHKQKVWDRYLFAELIIEECIDIVSAGGEFASRPKLVEQLKTHFGVEE